jgi:hypothetical protein
MDDREAATRVWLPARKQSLSSLPITTRVHTVRQAHFRSYADARQSQKMLYCCCSMPQGRVRPCRPPSSST